MPMNATECICAGVSEKVEHARDGERLLEAAQLGRVKVLKTLLARGAPIEHVRVRTLNRHTIFEPHQCPTDSTSPNQPLCFVFSLAVLERLIAPSFVTRAAWRHVPTDPRSRALRPHRVP